MTPAPEEFLERVSTGTQEYNLANTLANRITFAEFPDFRLRLSGHRNSEVTIDVLLQVFGGDILFGKYEGGVDAPTVVTVLLRNEDAVAVLNVGHSNVSFTLFGSDINNLLAWRSKIYDASPPIEPRNAREVTVGFWALDSEGNPRRNPRRIQGSLWGDIQQNYPDDVRKTLADLMKFQPPQDENGGKLILAHGPAGTGKTHWLRALALEWKDWCSTDYVIDPEAYFQHAFYMLSSFNEIEEEGEDMWKLLIVEDAGEFLRHDAKQQTGQGLSRLLNLTDGLLGQGIKLLVLMTTNEKMSSIHEAVHRPGRCLATVSFDAFTRSEAIEWAKEQKLEDFKADEEMTLAEMYEQAGKLPRITKDKDEYQPAGYV